MPRLYLLLSVLIAALVLSVGCNRSEDDTDDNSNAAETQVGRAEPEASQDWDSPPPTALESGWLSEHYALLAESRLEALVGTLVRQVTVEDATLQKLFDPSTEFSGWRPEDAQLVLNDINLTVRADQGDESEANTVWTTPDGSAALDVRSCLGTIMQPLNQHADLEYALDIENTLLLKNDGFVTEVNVTVSGRQKSLGSRALNMKWLLRWQPENDKQDARINAFRVTRMEDIQYRSEHETMFTDCTTSVIRSGALLSMQFGLGVDQWARRLGASRLSGWSGIAVADINGDGLEDFYVCQGKGLPNRMFAQRPDGTAEEVSLKSGIAFQEETKAALFADMDNDGDQDLILGLVTGVVLLENDGTGRFHYSSMLFDARETSCLSVADYNNDGLLDLLTCSYFREMRVDPDFADFNNPSDADNGGGARLYLNKGNLKMESAQQALGLEKKRFCREARFRDFDDDGDMDIAITNDFASVDLLQNNGDWFGKIQKDKYFDQSRLYRSLNWGDLDGDGREEMVCTTGATALTRRIAEQYVGTELETQISEEGLLALASPGFWVRLNPENEIEAGGELPAFALTGDTIASRLIDLTGNGQPEVVSVAGGITRDNRIDEASVLWRNLLPRFNTMLLETARVELAQQFVDFANRVRSGNSFAPRQRASLLFQAGDRWFNLAPVAGMDQPLDTRSLAYIDWDRDGDWDILRLNRRAPRLMVLRNNMTPANSLELKLRGTSCNRDAIGARVAVFIRGQSVPVVSTLDCRSGFLTQSSRRMLFALPQDAQVERIVVRWPGSGYENETFEPARQGRHWLLVQGEGQSRELGFETTSMMASQAEAADVVVKESTLWPKPFPPSLEYLREDGKWWTLQPDEQNMTLIHLWSEADQGLQENLSGLADFNRILRVVALNCDGKSEARSDELHVEHGVASAATLDKLKLFAMENFADKNRFNTPCWMVLDRMGRLAIVHSETLGRTQLESDIESFAKPLDDRYVAAPVFRTHYLALAGSPDYRRLAELYIRAGYPDEAKRFQSLATFQFAMGYCVESKTVLSQGRFPEALQLVTQAAKIDPACREAHLIMGGMHLMQAERNIERVDNLREASRAFENVLLIDPLNVEARMGLADIAHKKGNLDEAIHIIEAAIDKNESQASILSQTYTLYWIKGRLEFEKGDNVAASESLAKAYDLRPVEAGLATELGLVYADSDQFETAVEFFSQGEKYFPENPAYPRVVGVCCFILGRDREAVDKLEKVIVQQNRDYNTQLMLAWLLATSPDDSVRNGQRAVELAKPIHQRLGDAPLVNEVLAAAYAEVGEFGEAQSLQLKAIQIRESKTFRDNEVAPASEMRERLDQFYSQSLPVRMPANRLDEGHPFPRLIDVQGLNRKSIGR